ncbi:E3 ubiquitin-protein ligase HECTD3-like [Hydractinia symbiolongicarpus]|uniref:E3 ubiquitin-protein ligase HECTD3-like n=1 Tax=Hydractinia symbiolongicarpus TaxID=13093 RepID=UPI0025500221|nr:E3 ubiquitin-protein ligase HECTD3-like [Hydractinia symbiolongicarpus]
MSPNKARKRLACIRCVLDTVKRIKSNKPLPQELCFVPATIEYVISPDLNTVKFPLHFNVWTSPSKKDGKLVGRITVSESKVKEFSLLAYGEEFSNDAGDWIQIEKENSKSKIDLLFEAEDGNFWILLQARDAKPDSPLTLTAKYDIAESPTKSSESKDDIFGGLLSVRHKKGDKSKKKKTCYRWQNVVENSYMLHILPTSLPPNADEAAISRLSNPPPNWSLEADEELVRFLVDHCKTYDQQVGGASKYVESVTVSTEQDSAYNLLDGDSDTFWESDGSLGRHYIRLQIATGVIIQRLVMGVDQSDDNYMPSRVLVYGTTTTGQSRMLNETRIESTQTGDVAILENAAEYYPTVEIRIKECKDDGIDCRVHYIKIASSKHKQNGLNRNSFDKDLVRYPKLESVVDRELLYRRAQALTRFMILFDSVILYLLPTWGYTAGTYSCLEAMRQFFPLSRRRQGLILNCLRESVGATSPNMPKIYINRHIAAEHLVDPLGDPDAKNSIFNQLYEALRPEKCDVKLDYRWSLKYDQWWECKFIGEGIIDQGGGFRDSIADLAEELCPSSQDSLQPLPLPFFVRSPNQTATSNVYRDCYVPNAKCKLFAKYEWIGQLMGACLRGKENLVISLPPFIWKILNHEPVSFDKDYFTVDAAEVQFHEMMEKINEEKFKEMYEGVLVYTTVLSNGTEVCVKDNAGYVKYEDRSDFLRLVRENRMVEFQEQIVAIRNGLEKVVPKAVLTLLTWQELERRICGDPEISVEALKKSAHYDDFEDESDPTIKYMWQALENFTNEDRSRFLRFVTGRRRLPTPLYISKSKSSTHVNALPESATCSHTLFLPSYTSATQAEEKLRYAAYYCVSIDTDMSPWED